MRKIIFVPDSDVFMCLLLSVSLSELKIRGEDYLNEIIGCKLKEGV